MKSLKYSIRNKTTTSMKFDALLLRGILISEKELLISCMVITMQNQLCLKYSTHIRLTLPILMLSILFLLQAKFHSGR